jgi:hypothetical protein
MRHAALVARRDTGQNLSQSRQNATVANAMGKRVWYIQRRAHDLHRKMDLYQKAMQTLGGELVELGTRGKVDRFEEMKYHRKYQHDAAVYRHKVHEAQRLGFTVGRMHKVMTRAHRMIQDLRYKQRVLSIAGQEHRNDAQANYSFAK